MILIFRRKGFSAKALGLHGISVRCIAMWASYSRIMPGIQAVHKEGQSFPNKTVGGASIKEPTEVFNHPRVGIHVNLWVGERLLWPFRRFDAL